MTSLHIEFISSPAATVCCAATAAVLYHIVSDVTNELGSTALDMCIMMVAPPDRRGDQIKLANYLLDKGADPNNRGQYDGGGGMMMMMMMMIKVMVVVIMMIMIQMMMMMSMMMMMMMSMSMMMMMMRIHRVTHHILRLDKGGYSAIDHAAANNDEEIICLLLEFGANVLRVNHTLVAQRHHILRRVRRPACMYR